MEFMGSQYRAVDTYLKIRSLKLKKSEKQTDHGGSVTDGTQSEFPK